MNNYKDNRMQHHLHNPRVRSTVLRLFAGALVLLCALFLAGNYLHGIAFLVVLWTMLVVMRDRRAAARELARVDRNRG